MNWEANTIKRGMMLKLMPIPCVFQMNEVIATRRRTNNGGRCMLTSALDVSDTQASDSNFIHGWKPQQNR